MPIVQIETSKGPMWGEGSVFTFIQSEDGQS